MEAIIVSDQENDWSLIAKGSQYTFELDFEFAGTRKTFMDPRNSPTRVSATHLFSDVLWFCNEEERGNEDNVAPTNIWDLAQRLPPTH